MSETKRMYNFLDAAVKTVHDQDVYSQWNAIVIRLDDVERRLHKSNQRITELEAQLDEQNALIGEWSNTPSGVLLAARDKRIAELEAEIATAKAQVYLREAELQLPENQQVLEIRRLEAESARLREELNHCVNLLENAASYGPDDWPTLGLKIFCSDAKRFVAEAKAALEGTK